jgi:cardiolipin synthase
MHSPTTWEIYTEPNLAWDAMLKACKEAKHSIDLEQFIFVNDEIGKKFLDICIEKASEGVKVRFLLDAAGSFGFFSSSFIKNFERPNLQISFFNSFIPGTFGNHSLWLFRDHKKLLVVDNHIGFTGSMSLTAEIKEWRDLHVEIRGKVVEEMQKSFDSMWERAHKRKYLNKNNSNSNTDGFRYITNNPRPKKRFLYHTLIEAIRNAKSTIYLTTPYFVPDRRFIRVLKLARRRNVDIRLVIPEKSDHPVVDIGAKSFFTSLLKYGVKIYLHRNKIIHSKVVIIDNDWASVGSLNLDNISFLYNFEGNLISTDKRFIDELKMHFLFDCKNSALIDETVWKNRPFWQKILEFLVKPIRKIL